MIYNSTKSSRMRIESKIIIASLLVLSIFCNSGCMRALAKRSNTSSALVGTYYGGNKSVLILKNDGNADYYYSGQNDVKHSNRWSVNNNEITVNLSWMFCTVKGTIESDPTSFVLVGASELDDALWDDERFTKISDSTNAMTKDECDAFIADNSGTADYMMVDFHGLSVPVPGDFVATLSDSDDLQGYFNESDNAGIFLGYFPVASVLGEGEFIVAAESSIAQIATMFNPSEVVSMTNTTLGSYAAKEYEITGSFQNDNANIKGMMINYSEHGFVMLIMCVYKDDAAFVLDDYNYAVSYLRTNGPVGGSASNSSNSSTSSTDVRTVLDQYETFMNEYVDFMRTYSNADSEQMLSMMDDYSELMDEYVQMEQMISNLDVDSMSPEDYAYYIEVTTRVEQNLLTLYSTSS